MKKTGKPDLKMNQRTMLEYYQQFDPIEKKYKMYFDLCKECDHDEFFEKCYFYESNRQFSELTKKEFGDIYANLKLVYENEELTEEIIQIYDLVYDKVINQYLNIDGMERLFSENYINFEWEMHLGIDYSGHSMKFYRDHFIHQVRDAYCMDMLLQHGYADKIKSILGDEGSSKISRYVCKYINQQLECKGEVFLPESGTEETRRRFYLENIIYMSSYMSALFHDIGYPEVANMQSGRNILAYIANVYNFGSGHIDFDRIITVLQNSLLFRAVSPKEIRKRIEGEKIDHGAVSALMFLLHFYENGAIYGLEPYKKCAVEIAGLAIYNHTNSYAYLLDKKDMGKALYYKSAFALNPISYLLRISDDLQEWDRIYFEISAGANIILCNKCHTPIVRREWKEENDVYYLCNCNKKDVERRKKTTGVFETVFRRGSFPYRRLYNVTVCEELRFWTYEDEKKHVFELNYDLERLLYVAYINPSYAKYRIKELNMLKKMFVRQDVEEMTYIEYFMSANILLIKAQIVGKYMEYLDENGKLPLSECVERISTMVKNDLNASNLSDKTLHEKLKEEAQSVYGEVFKYVNLKELPDEVKQYFDNNIYIYIYLYFVMRLGMYANCADTQNKEICDVIKNLWKNFEKDSRYAGEALFLIKDCCKQAGRMYEHLLDYHYFPDKYFEQFKSDEGMEAYFFRFAHSDNYEPIKHREAKEVNKLDAYTDLYFFKVILREMKTKKSDKK